MFESVQSWPVPNPTAMLRLMHVPRYYFDIFDGTSQVTDTEGSQHASIEEARHEAVDTLTRVSRESFPLDGPSSVSADIREENGPVLERVIVTLSFQRL